MVGPLLASFWKSFCFVLVGPSNVPFYLLWYLSDSPHSDWLLVVILYWVHQGQKTWSYSPPREMETPSVWLDKVQTVTHIKCDKHATHGLLAEAVLLVKYHFLKRCSFFMLSKVGQMDVDFCAPASPTNPSHDQSQVSATQHSSILSCWGKNLA